MLKPHITLAATMMLAGEDDNAIFAAIMSLGITPGCARTAMCRVRQRLALRKGIKDHRGGRRNEQAAKNNRKVGRPKQENKP